MPAPESWCGVRHRGRRGLRRERAGREAARRPCPFSSKTNVTTAVPVASTPSVIRVASAPTKIVPPATPAMARTTATRSSAASVRRTAGSVGSDPVSDAADGSAASGTLGRGHGLPPRVPVALCRRRTRGSRWPRARCAEDDPLAGSHLRAERPVHAERPGGAERPRRPAPGRHDRHHAGAGALQRARRGPRDADAHAAAARCRPRPAPVSTPTCSRSQTGRPSGIFMRDGELAVAPERGPLERGRPVRRDARRAPRVAARHLGRHRPGACPGPAQRPAGDRRCGSHHACLRSDTPALPGGIAVVLFPFPLPSPGVDLPATVVEMRPADAPVAIPPGGAVLLGSGSAAAALSARGVPGEPLTVRLDLLPDWDALVSAVGGGPQIVRDGVPVFRANETFTSSQLGQRAPRSAVGQRADGRVVLVAVDGRQPGYSVGLTNFELAQALVRLGAVTGMALDGGGSTTMAFDGRLLSRPSGTGERAIASALMFQYTGRVRPAAAATRVTGSATGWTTHRHSPSASCGRRPRPSRSAAPDGSVAFTETGPRDPGSHPVAFPPAALGGAAAAPLPEGRWTLKLQGIDDLGRTTTMTRTFVVNTTLGFVRPERNVLRLPPKGAEIRILWKLTRQARVGVTIEYTRRHRRPRLLAAAVPLRGRVGHLERPRPRQEAGQGRPLHRARDRREHARDNRADATAHRAPRRRARVGLRHAESGVRARPDSPDKVPRCRWRRS